MKFFKNYITYLKDNPHGYWFKRKRYGWGWVPARKEGWFAILAYAALVSGIVVRAGNLPSAHDALLQITLPVIVLTILLLTICYKKGERPRWQWGSEK